jgi:hypothetical protein
MHAHTDSYFILVRTRRRSIPFTPLFFHGFLLLYSGHYDDTMLNHRHHHPHYPNHITVLLLGRRHGRRGEQNSPNTRQQIFVHQPETSF